MCNLMCPENSTSFTSNKYFKTAFRIFYNPSIRSITRHLFEFIGCILHSSIAFSCLFFLSKTSSYNVFNLNFTQYAFLVSLLSYPLYLIFFKRNHLIMQRLVSLSNESLLSFCSTSILTTSILLVLLSVCSLFL